MTLELFYGNIRKAYECDSIWLQRLNLQFDIEKDSKWRSGTLEQHNRSVFHLLSLKSISQYEVPILQLFARSRGCHLLLSPRDFQLLKLCLRIIFAEIRPIIER
jgi:hypothetical protein